jgi:uncharacterized protein
MNSSLNPSSIVGGLELFNDRRFFDAHEAWEDVWREMPRAQAAARRHMQGLIQMAVAFHHWTTGNITGARSVLRRSLRNLDGAESSFPSIALARLRNDAELWSRYMEDVANELPPALPRIMFQA